MFRTAILAKADGPYLPGRAVTTDPQEAAFDPGATPKGKPVRVDEERFDAWAAAGHFREDSIKTVRQEGDPEEARVEPQAALSAALSADPGQTLNPGQIAGEAGEEGQGNG